MVFPVLVHIVTVGSHIWLSGLLYYSYLMPMMFWVQRQYMHYAGRVRHRVKHSYRLTVVTNLLVEIPPVLSEFNKKSYRFVVITMLVAEAY